MKKYSYTFCPEKEKAYRPCGKYAFVKNDVFYWKRRGIKMGKCRIKKYRFPLLECGMFCINLNFYLGYIKPYPDSLPFHAVQDSPAFFVNGKSILYKTVEFP